VKYQERVLSAGFAAAAAGGYAQQPNPRGGDLTVRIPFLRTWIENVTQWNDHQTFFWKLLLFTVTKLCLAVLLLEIHSRKQIT
jgi:hypothetical protein